MTERLKGKSFNHKAQWRPNHFVISCESFFPFSASLRPVWPDWAMYWTLGKFLKPLATINFPKSPTLLAIFCKVVKIYHFSSEIIFG